MEPYEKMRSRPPSTKCEVEAKAVTVFGNKREDRRLGLMTTYTRVVKKNDIHEFIVTDEPNVYPGDTVDRVAYVCFAEITTGGAIMCGDRVFSKGVIIGEIRGFDETHAPNHINILMYADDLKSGFEYAMKVGERITITDPV